MLGSFSVIAFVSLCRELLKQVRFEEPIDPARVMSERESIAILAEAINDSKIIEPLTKGHNLLQCTPKVVAEVNARLAFVRAQRDQIKRNRPR